MSIEELVKDEAFAAQIDAAENLEEVANLFREKGFDFSAAELKNALDSAKNGELDEANLENVAGGSLAGVAIGIAVGYLIGRAASRGRRW